MTVEDIRIRKKRLKLTTQQLALLAELPLSTVSKIMTGETKNPSYLTIEKLEATIEKEEMLARVEAYQKAMHQSHMLFPERKSLLYMVICNSSQITELGVVGAPDWVIEVVSLGTRQYDHHKKLHKYMDAGVREYWIVYKPLQIIQSYVY